MEFKEWVREVINSQAVANGNGVSLDDFSKDGNTEYLYPRQFIVNGDEYRWIITRKPTRGKSCSTHYVILFGGKCFNIHNTQIATGELTKSKIHKGLRIIYDYYQQGA